MHVCIIWKMINAINLNPIITSFIRKDVHLRLLILTKRILCNLYSHQRRAGQLFFQAEFNISVYAHHYIFMHITTIIVIARKFSLEVQLNA